MNKKIDYIKAELTECLKGTCDCLSKESIVEILSILNKMSKSKKIDISIDSTPMIGLNPFKFEYKKKKPKQAKDLNESLNYRVNPIERGPVNSPPPDRILKEGQQPTPPKQK